MYQTKEKSLNWNGLLKHVKLQNDRKIRIKIKLIVAHLLIDYYKNSVALYITGFLFQVIIPNEVYKGDEIGTVSSWLLQLVRVKASKHCCGLQSKWI